MTREQIEESARAEFEWIERLWREMEKVWPSGMEVAEISANPAALKAVREHKAGKTKFGKIGDIRPPER